MTHPLVLAIAQEAGAGATPYYVGGLILVVLFALMFALLAFGKGRDHS